MRRRRVLAGLLGWAAVSAVVVAPAAAAKAHSPAPRPRLEKLARILELEAGRTAGQGELDLSLIHISEPTRPY